LSRNGSYDNSPNPKRVWKSYALRKGDEMKTIQGLLLTMLAAGAVMLPACGDDGGGGPSIS